MNKTRRWPVGGECSAEEQGYPELDTEEDLEKGDTNAGLDLEDGTYEKLWSKVLPVFNVFCTVFEKTLDHPFISESFLGIFDPP